MVSVTRIDGGHAYNIIPESVTIAGTFRCLDTAVLHEMRARMKTVVTGVAAAFGATAEIRYPVEFLPTMNNPTCADMMANAAVDICGASHVDRNMTPVMASEDFSYMLDRVPGAYMCLGNGNSEMLHHPEYNFNDEALAYGASILAKVSEDVLSV